MGDCGFREGSGPAVPRDLKCRGGSRSRLFVFFRSGTLIQCYVLTVFTKHRLVRVKVEGQRPHPLFGRLAMSC